LTAILAGVAIHRWIPVRVLSDALVPWLGVAGVLIGLGIGGWSFWEFRKVRNFPGGPTGVLVTTGPFRFSRNPMYVAMSSLQLGIGLWLNTAWIIVLLVPIVVFIHRSVIEREERYMTEKFGEPYRVYQGAVRRWF
jgi:protein-S-isoprenylcysteine O-methyltransferase Ste14